MCECAFNDKVKYLGVFYATIIGLLLKWDLVAILLNPLGIEEGYRISEKYIHKYVRSME
jgi:hypothetical protein